LGGAFHYNLAGLEREDLPRELDLCYSDTEQHKPQKVTERQKGGKKQVIRKDITKADRRKDLLVHKSPLNLVRRQVQKIKKTKKLQAMLRSGDLDPRDKSRLSKSSIDSPENSSISSLKLGSSGKDRLPSKKRRDPRFDNWVQQQKEGIELAKKLSKLKL